MEINILFSLLVSMLQIRIGTAQWRVKDKVFEIRPAPGTPILGFVVTVKHNEDGYLSQLKILHIRGIKNHGEKKVEFQTIHEIQSFVLPKVVNGTQLFYDFLISDVTSYASFNFELLSSYGGPTYPICPPKFALY